MYSKKLGLKLLPSGTLESLGGQDKPKYLWSPTSRKLMYEAYESKRHELLNVTEVLTKFLNYAVNLSHKEI